MEDSLTRSLLDAAYASSVRRALGIAGLGIAGIVLAIALSLGTFALAGRAVGEPATAVHITTSAPHTPSGERSPSPAATHTHPPKTPATPIVHGSGSSPEPADEHGEPEHGTDD